MRPSDDESDDERGLLSEKWMTRSEKRSWQIWVASALCLFAGFALGTLFHKMPTPEILKKQQNSSVIAKAPFGTEIRTSCLLGWGTECAQNKTSIPFSNRT